MHRPPTATHPLARPPAQAGLPAAQAAALPSLAQVLQRYREHGTAASGAALGWHGTRPQALEPADGRPTAPVVPFDEVIHGLHTRELVGAELFEHFFGPGAAG